ncbi:hypothetical protein H2202_002209 [Exophiala xenobiotica]|nr:hypothetical protein H2202_002209 [Exophiala xenobiotica]
MAKRHNRSQNTSKQVKPPSDRSFEEAKTLTPSKPSEDIQKPRSLLATIADIRTLRALQLVLLASLHAAVSQLNLSPVYGAVPASLYHRYGLTASFMLAFLLRGYLPPWTALAITPFCFWIPVIQFGLFTFSSYMGNPLGPVITECLTCFPLVLLSVQLAMQCLDDVNAERTSSMGGDAFPSMGLFVLFTVLQRACKGFAASFTGPGFLRSRIGMQLMIASLTTEVLDNTLALYNYTLLERKESVTGYISVLEDNQRGFRVMRCDHSLLGGEWKMSAQSNSKSRVGEPIYAIFTMLEAVRLVERSSPNRPRALSIGLGVGTAPSAMIAHGINTTIIEVDPVVHEFALKYFGLPHNHTCDIDDAVAAVANRSSFETNSYDYIIHDVFTGGAEPVELFTEEFLIGLRTLLRPDGVVAINYAGDISMPASSIIYRTITSVFPSCRVFREDEAPAAGVKPDDFTNMVFFCRKSDSPINFRRPVEADFLGSNARREYMLPTHEISPSSFDASVDVLRSGKTKQLEKWQAQSAIGHWRVMRTVLPAAVWNNW